MTPNPVDTRDVSSPAAAGGALALRGLPIASLAALWLCCGIELLVPITPVTPPFLGYLTLLTLLLGLLHGTLWHGAFALLRTLPRPLALGSWFVASFASAAWLANQLGAFTRLHSRYGKLAIIVLAVTGAAGLALGALCAAMQPTASQPLGFLVSRSLRVRGVSAAALLAAFAGLQWADRRFFPGQYPLAHGGLRLAALWCVMFAIVLVLPKLPRPGRFGWTLALACYVLCMILLDTRRVATLAAFDARPWSASVLTAARSLIDVDRDGHAAFLGDSDCAPWNPRIHPGADDIPDNGIDENCAFGDATKQAQHVALVPISHDPPPLDVVLITADAWNQQHIGLYNPQGYGPTGRATTPLLDAWAKNATVFERAYSPGGWTSIAIPSLLRGVYARRLQWRRFYETNLDAMVAQKQLGQLRPGERPMHMFPFAFGDPHPTLPEMLKRRGFSTHAVTDDGYTAMLQSGTGVDRGFDSYRVVDSLPPEQRLDSGTAELAIRTLDGLRDKPGFFLWVHFFGTHYPDDRHPGVHDYGARPEDLYDHEVAYLDTQLARVLDAVGRSKRPVAVFVSADHGEGFNSVTRYHGDTLDDPVIRIPLLARVPGWPARRIAQPVSSIDLIPTILGLIHAPIPPYLDGIDLATTLDGDDPGNRMLFSDTWRYDPAGNVLRDVSAAYDADYKFILDRRSGILYRAYQVESRWDEHLLAVGLTGDVPKVVYGHLEAFGPVRLSN